MGQEPERPVPISPDHVMPLVAGPIEMSATEVSVDLGDRTVKVESSLAAPLLGMCNGRRTVGQLVESFGDDARGILEAMIDAGALVDSADAWKILHRQSSAGTNLGHPISPSELADLLRSSFAPCLDGEARVAGEPRSSRVVDLARARHSTRPDDPVSPLGLPELGTVLSAMFSFDETNGNGTHGSAGGLYPLAIHVLVRDPIGPVSPGLWWHDPRELCLRPAVVGDVDQSVEGLFVSEPSPAPMLERGGPIIFLSADVDRPSRKYGVRGYRFALIEAGSALQSAALAATELGIPLRAIGGIDDRATHRYLALPGRAVCLLAIVLG